MAHIAVDFFKERAGVDAVLVVASCARGVATPGSDLDMVTLASSITHDERSALEVEWEAFKAANAKITELDALGLATALHLDVIDGVYEPVEWDDGGGPDDFEVAIGNHVAYSVPLWTGSDAFEHLKQRWLPYYNDALQQRRFAMVKAACFNDLVFAEHFIGRDQPFRAFELLYKAYKEFLQALFIARRTYPIVYWKWIREQIVEMLGEPDLYGALPAVLEVRSIEGDSMLRNAELLRNLVDRWL
ncbi:MAG: hypothetical protein WD826_06690 [Actinomycetota bacterium]